MPTITLEDLEAKQSELANLIAKFKRQAEVTTTLVVPEAFIDLAPGERYAGLLLADDGTLSHHLVLLPHKPDGDLAWQAAKDWATSVGGELPTRQEQALLSANLKAEFERAWYWSSEAHESEGSYAWYQTFDYGYQYYDHKSYEGQARAVRRFTD